MNWYLSSASDAAMPSSDAEQRSDEPDHQPLGEEYSADRTRQVIPIALRMPISRVLSATTIVRCRRC